MKKLITFILIVTLALSCVVVSACGRTTSQEYSYSKISVSRKSNQVSISKPLDLLINSRLTAHSFFISFMYFSKLPISKVPTPLP